MSSDIGKYYDPISKIIAMPDDDFEAPVGGLGYVLYNSMEKHEDLIAQIDVTSGKTEYYSSFLQRCIRSANGLIQHGIKPGNIVSICSYNNMDCGVAYISIYLIGAVAASLDPTLSEEDTEYLINLVKPKAYFISDNAEHLIETAIEKLNHKAEIIVFGKTNKHISFEDFINKQADKDKNFVPHYEINLEKVTTILFSSGTTGLPKGICHNHRFLLYASRNADFKSFLGFSSFYWASMTVFTLSTIIHGKQKLIIKKFDPKLLWKYLEQYEETFMFMAPCDAIQLYRNRPENHITPLKLFMTGGSNISVDYLKKLKETMPKTIVINGYGQTELFNIFNNYHPSLQNKLDSIGVPNTGRHYKIVDPDTEEILGFNQIGEMRIKTKLQMSGYYNQDCSEIYDKDGFMKTGDICYYDKDFCFFIVDRIKEMFKYKSWHLVPAKIEAKLVAHPDVKYGVVIGIPQPEDDNHALAIVVPTDGHKSSTDDIKMFVEDQLDDRHKLRAGVMFVKSLPFTPSGKIKRMLLKKLYVNGELK